MKHNGEYMYMEWKRVFRTTIYRRLLAADWSNDLTYNTQT